MGCLGLKVVRSCCFWVANLWFMLRMLCSIFFSRCSSPCECYVLSIFLQYGGMWRLVCQGILTLASFCICICTLSTQAPGFPKLTFIRRKLIKLVLLFAWIQREREMRFFKSIYLPSLAIYIAKCSLTFAKIHELPVTRKWFLARFLTRRGSRKNLIGKSCF